MIKLNPPFINTIETMPLIESILKSGILTQGPMVEELEDLSAQMADTNHAVAVSSATVGLELVLATLKIKPGDEVITTPFTFKATINAILRAGATPRFADICDDYTIDPESVAKLVSEKTVAIIPVHIYGYPADLRAIGDVINNFNVVIIEDAAQAHGSLYRGDPVGSQSYAGVFSFYGTKNVGAGEGGVITTNSSDLADVIRSATTHGRSRRMHPYPPKSTNARLPELTCAVAIPQLKRLKEVNDIRRSNALYLSAYTGQQTHMTSHFRKSNFHLYTIEMDKPDAFIKWMKSRGIECGAYYRYIFDSYMLHGTNMLDRFPKAYEKAARVVSLPVHPGLSEEDLHFIGESYREYTQAI